MWPSDPDALATYQRRLAHLTPPDVDIDPSTAVVAACWACFPRGLAENNSPVEDVWCGAAATQSGHLLETRTLIGTTSAAYTPGLMALRAGQLLETVIASLSTHPQVVLLDATGRDHPRRAGLAIHLGAVIDVPTIGVTHRPLLADGTWPADPRGSVSPLRIGDETVAYWVRTQIGRRPLAVHPGWRITSDQAIATVMATSRYRTPEPLRVAREAARTARDANRS